MIDLVNVSNNSRVIDVDIEDWEAILNQEITVDYNTVYVCKEVEDFVLSATTMALLFNLKDTDIKNALIKYGAQREKWGLEELTLDIKVTYSDGRHSIRRGINRELALYIAFNTNSIESIAIQEYVNQIVKDHIYTSNISLNSGSATIAIPSYIDKAPIEKEKISNDVNNVSTKTQKELYPNYGKRWSVEEDDTLAELLFERGVMFHEIANILGRPKSSVELRPKSKRFRGVPKAQTRLYGYQEEY